MATTTYIFRGKAVYPMLVKPDDFNGEKFWKIGLAMDEASKRLFKMSGLKLRPKSHDDPELNDFVVFRRPVAKVIKGEERTFAPPKIEGWNPEEVVLGNGSEVEVYVEVYDTRFGKGHRLAGVKAINVVPFEGETGQKVIRPEDIDDNDSDKPSGNLNDAIPF